MRIKTTAAPISTSVQPSQITRFFQNRRLAPGALARIVARDVTVTNSSEVLVIGLPGKVLDAEGLDAEVHEQSLGAGVLSLNAF